MKISLAGFPGVTTAFHNSIKEMLGPHDDPAAIDEAVDFYILMNLFMFASVLL